MSNNSVIIIGGGAAGLMAAYFAAKSGKDVTIIEKNDKVGKKILITGKGRCNITNSANREEFFENILVNSKFMYKAFGVFDNNETISFFEEKGLPLKIERGKRVFPVSDRAADVVKILEKAAKNENVKILTGIRAENILLNDGAALGVKTDKGCFYAKSVIIATGGKSYPGTGSTGDGYEFAKKAGHSIVEIMPSLVPLETNSMYKESLKGLSLKNISFKLINNFGKTVFEDFGELLFTHFGISGPIVLSASCHMKKNEKYKAVIDLKPALNEQELNNRILRDFEELKNKDFSNSLNKLLPKSLIDVIIELSCINPDKKVNQITREERIRLVKLLKNFTLEIKGMRPVSEAVITAGGVNTKEINPYTMESRLVKGLYFAGEVLDIHAYTGGFNLQIAFSTGKLAGISS